VREVEKLLKDAMVAENVFFTDSQAFTDEPDKLNALEPDVALVRGAAPDSEGVVSLHLVRPDLVYLSSRTDSGRGLYVKLAFVAGQGFVRRFAKSREPASALEQEYQDSWTATRGRT
jgi:hypothetical protein